jgi:hypothetical protein
LVQGRGQDRGSIVLSRIASLFAADASFSNVAWNRSKNFGCSRLSVMVSVSAASTFFSVIDALFGQISGPFVRVGAARERSVRCAVLLDLGANRHAATARTTPEQARDGARDVVHAGSRCAQLARLA